MRKWWKSNRKLVLAGALAVVMGASVMAATDRQLCEVIPFIFGATFKMPVGWLCW